MNAKWISAINVGVNGDNGFYEHKTFQGERCMEEFLEYLCELGFYSEVTLQQKISAKDAVMKRLKGE